jgi:hypothetical protein
VLLPAKGGRARLSRFFLAAAASLIFAYVEFVKMILLSCVTLSALPVSIRRT